MENPPPQDAPAAAAAGVPKTLELPVVPRADDAKKPAKRLCRFPGCPRVVKSQGHCQRHGAKAKRCRIENCDKQAQGTFDGMCKRHWKETNFPGQGLSAAAAAKVQQLPPPEPQGESVYDNVLPQSIAYRPTAAASASKSKNNTQQETPLMPLVTYLREGRSAAPGWHRNSERLARGIHPVPSLSSQFEAWERQLALVEILLLSGGTPGACFKDLAFAWGREKNFHLVLASSVCERRGDVERKRRKDPAPTSSPQEQGVKKAKPSQQGHNNNSSSSSSSTILLTTNHHNPGVASAAEIAPAMALGTPKPS